MQDLVAKNSQPTFSKMLDAYKDYRGNSNPCRRGQRNQCAIRMSIALVRNGFSLDNYGSPQLIHDNPQRCGTSFPHIAGANSLANYIGRLWGAPRRFSGSRLPSARSTLQGKSGIIYFNNCFVRARDRTTNGEEPLQRGDHIDLWNGREYFNQILHARVGGNAAHNAPLFDRAQHIKFWPLY